MPAEHRNVSLSRRHFNRLADEYDSAFVRQMPTYDQMHETVLAMTALNGRDVRRILEVGAGTGTLTKKLLERFPGAEVTALDLSAEMLAVARTKLAFAGERVILREVDVSSSDLGSGYDAAVSTIAFHHVPARRKRPVIGALHDALNEGGALVIGDTFKAASPQIADGLRRMNEERLREAGMSDEDIEQRRARARHSGGSSALVRDYERWFKQAGFVSVDCVWKDMSLAVVYGEKRS